MSCWRIWRLPRRWGVEGCSWFAAGVVCMLWSEFCDPGAGSSPLLAVASALLLTGIVVRLVTWWNRTGLAAQGVVVGPGCLLLGLCVNWWAELVPVGSAAWYAMPVLGLGLMVGGPGWQLVGLLRTVRAQSRAGAAHGQERP